MRKSGLVSGILIGAGLWAATACSSDSKPAAAPAASRLAVAVGATVADTTGGLLGKTLYKQQCVRCHGLNGDKCLYSARNLQESTLSLEGRVALLTHGRGKMPAFGASLNAEQLDAVARYSRTLFRHLPAHEAAPGQ